MTGDWIRPDYAGSKQEEFNIQAGALAERFPAIREIISTDIMEERNALMRNAQKANADAGNSPSWVSPGGSLRNSSAVLKPLHLIRHNGAWRCSVRAARPVQRLPGGSARPCSLKGCSMVARSSCCRGYPRSVSAKPA